MERAGGALFAACLFGIIVEEAWLAFGHFLRADRAGVPWLGLGVRDSGRVRIRVRVRVGVRVRVRARG